MNKRKFEDQDQNDEQQHVEKKNKQQFLKFELEDTSKDRVDGNLYLPHDVFFNKTLSTVFEVLEETRSGNNNTTLLKKINYTTEDIFKLCQPAIKEKLKHELENFFPNVIGNIILEYDIDQKDFLQIKSQEKIWQVDNNGLRLIHFEALWRDKNRFVLFKEQDMIQNLLESLCIHENELTVSSAEFEEILNIWDMLRRFIFYDSMRTPLEHKKNSNGKWTIPYLNKSDLDWQTIFDKFVTGVNSYCPDHPCRIVQFELFLMASQKVLGKHKIIASILKVVKSPIKKELCQILSKLLTCESLCTFWFRDTSRKYTQEELYQEAQKRFSTVPEKIYESGEMGLFVPYLRDNPESCIFVW